MQNFLLPAGECQMLFPVLCSEGVTVYCMFSSSARPIKNFMDLPLVYGDPTGMYDLALKLEQRWAECSLWARYGM
jgi:hypothetical protein